METVKGILKNKKGKKSPHVSDANLLDAASGKPLIDAGSKTATFNELNVLETFHPLNKDYGHMIIDEPKTPYVRDSVVPTLDPDVLLEKLQKAARAQTPAFGFDDSESSDDEDYPESLEEKVRRLEFERRRKAHYKEFYSVGLARKLIEEEWGEMDYSDDYTICGESFRSGFREEGCEMECPGYSQLMEHSVESPKISSDDTDDSVANDSLEPENDPTHPCYQHLRAQIDGEKPKTFSNAEEGV